MLDKINFCCRLLISFGGKYLPYNYHFASSHSKIEGDPLTFEHQLCKICVPHTEPDIFGPAFIEVNMLENRGPHINCKTTYLIFLGVMVP